MEKPRASQRIPSRPLPVPPIPGRSYLLSIEGRQLRRTLWCRCPGVLGSRNGIPSGRYFGYWPVTPSVTTTGGYRSHRPQAFAIGFQERRKVERKLLSGVRISQHLNGPFTRKREPNLPRIRTPTIICYILYQNRYIDTLNRFFTTRNRCLYSTNIAK